MLRLWKHLPLLCVLLFLGTLLTACATAKPQASSESPAPTASAPAPDSEPATKVYKDALGREVTIPTHPKRIVTMQYLPEMLAIDVKPVGVVTHLLTNFTAVKDRISGIEDIGDADNPNLEKTLELKPDLIIAAEWNQDQLDNLNKIAPTVVVKWEGSDALQHFRDVADVLGETDKAEAWIQRFNQKAEAARAKLASAAVENETFGVVVIGGFEKGQLRVYGNGNVGYTLFDTLKLSMTDTVKTEWDKGNHELGMNISLEKLPEFASADRLFVVRFDNDPEFLAQVDDSRLWKNLPAVKNNRVYTVDPDLWFSYDVLSFEAQLDDALKLLLP